MWTLMYLRAIHMFITCHVGAHLMQCNTTDFIFCVLSWLLCVVFKNRIVPDEDIMSTHRIVFMTLLWSSKRHYQSQYFVASLLTYVLGSTLDFNSILYSSMPSSLFLQHVYEVPSTSVLWFVMKMVLAEKRPWTGIYVCCVGLCVLVFFFFGGGEGWVYLGKIYNGVTWPEFNLFLSYQKSLKC